MAAPTPHRHGPAEIIDLVSDDDRPLPHPYRLSSSPPHVEIDSDTDSSSSSSPAPSRHVEVQHHRPSPSPPRNQPLYPRGAIVNLDGEEIFIPDDDQDNVHNNAFPPHIPAQSQHPMLAQDNDQVCTIDDCLQRVLDIFPDISHAYVRNLYNQFDEEGDYETLPGPARLENIIEQLVSANTYPKQDKGKKRKREESRPEQPGQQWELKDRVPIPTYLKGSMQAMLKADFPEIPVQYINNTLANEVHFYHAYVFLAQIQDTSDHSSRPYGRGRPSSKHLADAVITATNCGWPDLLEELHAARRRVEDTRAQRAAEDTKKKAEQENLRKAIAAGETAECSACYDLLPMNRQMHCNGTVAHFTCFECVEMYIKAEVGESRCRVICPAGCGAGFSKDQLDQLSDKQLLQKFEQLQQEKDIRDAGLEDLEDCPFCDYKAILPPVDEDFEFRCANPECEMVSCRRCKSISHVPVSCEQHAKDNKINSRHKIEEAMTAALIRSCNKCKKQFIKEYGCNKMTCSSCGNLQCYVCSASVKNYNHFDQTSPSRSVAGGKSKGCPLYDNVEERHEREVKEAEDAARAQVIEENPDVTAEDLEIKVSEAVKKATADRIRQAGGPAGAIGGLHPPLPAGGLVDILGILGGNQARNAEAGMRVAVPAVRRQMAHRGRRNGHRAADAVARFPIPPPIPGYVPVVGYYPIVPPPYQPGLEAAGLLRPQVNAQAPPPQPPVVQTPPPLDWDRIARQVPARMDNDVFNDFAFLGDGAGDVRPQLAPQPQPAAHAFPARPYPFYHLNYNDIFANPPAPMMQNHLRGLPMTPPMQAAAAAAPQPVPPDHHRLPQAFQPNIREQRQGFQHLEMRRLQHDEAQRHQQQEMQRQQQMREQFRALQERQMQERQQRMQEVQEREEIQRQFARFEHWEDA